MSYLISIPKGIFITYMLLRILRLQTRHLWKNNIVPNFTRKYLPLTPDTENNRQEIVYWCKNKIRNESENQIYVMEKCQRMIDQKIYIRASAKNKKTKRTEQWILKLRTPVHLRLELISRHSTLQHRTIHDVTACRIFKACDVIKSEVPPTPQHPPLHPPGTKTLRQ